LKISFSIAHQVASNGAPVLTDNAQEDYRFSNRTSVIFLRLRSILCVPLTIKEKIIGVVYVDNRMVKGVFTPPDLELLNAIASSAAIAMRTPVSIRLLWKKDVWSVNSKLPTRFRSVYCQRLYRPAWLEFAALWQPAHQVAGDFYDFIHLGQGQLGMLIADVAGEGVPAALFMTLAHTIYERVCASLLQPLPTSSAPTADLR